MEKTIEIPKGYKARIEGNKIILEPKESEDERIRKQLLNWFKECHWDAIDEDKTPLKREDIIAWLEKQGEKEYALKSSKDVDVHKFVQYIERQAKAYELNLPNRSYDIYGFAKDILSWLEKQGEKKPIPRFSIGDFVKDTNYKGEPIYEIVYIDSECYICEYRGKENMGDRYVMHFAFDNPYLRYAQNPAWSEEDEKMIEFWNLYYEHKVGDMPNKDVVENLEKFQEWLKFLKERVQPQNK